MLTPLFLTYPRHWKGAIHPDAYPTAKKTEMWLQSRGLLQSDLEKAQFEALQAHDYVGRTFSRVPNDRFKHLMRFFVVWILYDDVVEEGGMPSQLNFDHSPSFSSHPLLTALTDVNRNLSKSMPSDWISEHMALLKIWAKAAVSERQTVERFRQEKKPPNLDEYILMRRHGNGMLSTVHLLEYAHAQMLPPYLRQSSILKEFINCAADIISFMNDMYSYSKDAAHQWCNLVQSLAHTEALSLLEAFERLGRMHNEYISRLIHLHDDLLALCASSDLPFVKEWIASVGQIILGFAEWHKKAPRYSARHCLDEEHWIQLEPVLI